MQMNDSAMPSPQEREAALFALALEKPVAERPAFLQAVCGSDRVLRQRLETLLAAHDQPGELLAIATPGLKATIKLELSDAPDEAVGQTLGRYKLLERVGEGGCGVVYVAEQTEPVRRRVALKVIDASTPDVGRPFFVMEPVRGIRITDYCAQANLSTKDRPDLSGRHFQRN